MRVVADRHAFTAGSTDHQSLQQRRALACRSTVPFRAPGERIALHSLAVQLVLFPGNIARMNVAKQDPLLAWYQTRAHLAIGQMALFGATENECAGIARVVDDLPCAAVQKLGPDQFTLMRPAAQRRGNRSPFEWNSLTTARQDPVR